MVWTVSAQQDRTAGGYAVVSEEAAGAGTQTKTLVWGTDLAFSLGFSGQVAEVLGVRAEITPDATVGNRRLAVQILDASDDVLGETASAQTTPASTALVVEFGQGWSTGSAAIETAGTVVRSPLQVGLHLIPGMKLKVFDQAGIAPADSIVVHVRLRAAK